MTGNPNALFNQPVKSLSFEDLYGDGRSDIVWRNTKTGENAVWRMNGSTATGAFLPQIGLDWNSSVGDFTGEGRSDFFWRNQKTGENQVWLMNGSSLTAIANLPSLELNWNPTIANFTGGVKNDLFWHNQQTGDNQVWLMNGTNPTVSNIIDGAGAGLRQFDGNWDYKPADFTGNGKSGILWHNRQTNEIIIWQMDGATVTKQGSVNNFVLNNPANPLPASDQAWDFLIGDFNGDRKSDIFWHNKQTGENQVWEMDGTRIIGYAELPQLDPNWDPKIADFKGNGQDDIFWHNTKTGENAAWLMDGVKATGYTLPTQLSPAWQPSIGSFKGDGGKTTDIFWHNTDTAEDAVWLTNGVNASGVNVTGYFLPTQLSKDWVEV